MSEKRFPLLGNQANIGSIPYWVAEQAYMVYANKYGDQQSLERLAERGGFGIEEMDEYYPEWRAKCSIIDRLQKQRDNLLQACEGLMKKADDGSADFDDPEPGSIYLKAIAAIAKAKP